MLHFLLARLLGFLLVHQVVLLPFFVQGHSLIALGLLLVVAVERLVLLEELSVLGEVEGGLRRCFGHEQLRITSLADS